MKPLSFLVILVTLYILPSYVQPTGDHITRGFDYLSSAFKGKSDVNEEIIEETSSVAKYVPHSLRKIFVKPTKKVVIQSTGKNYGSYVGAGIIGFKLGAATSLLAPYGIGAAIGIPSGIAAGAKLGKAKGRAFRKVIYKGKSFGKRGHVYAKAKVISPVYSILPSKSRYTEKVLTGAKFVMPKLKSVAASAAALSIPQVQEKIGKARELLTSSDVIQRTVDFAKDAAIRLGGDTATDIQRQIQTFESAVNNDQRDSQSVQSRSDRPSLAQDVIQTVGEIIRGASIRLSAEAKEQEAREAESRSEGTSGADDLSVTKFKSFGSPKTRVRVHVDDLSKISDLVKPGAMSKIIETTLDAARRMRISVGHNEPFADESKTAQSKISDVQNVDSSDAQVKNSEQTFSEKDAQTKKADVQTFQQSDVQVKNEQNQEKVEQIKSNEQVAEKGQIKSEEKIKTDSQVKTVEQVKQSSNEPEIKQIKSDVASTKSSQSQVRSFFIQSPKSQVSLSRSKRDTHAARVDSVSPKHELAELDRLIRFHRAEGCLQRVICELSVAPDSLGSNGLRFAVALLKLGKHNHPASAKYRSAQIYGNEKRNMLACYTKYSCSLESSKIIAMGNAVLENIN